MSKITWTKKEKSEKFDQLLQLRGKQLAYCVKHISASGMTRIIDFYVDSRSISHLIAAVADETYVNDRHRGIKITGCGMDMARSVIYNLNYFMATKITGRGIQELLKTGECGKHIYDNYFFDADKMISL